MRDRIAWSKWKYLSGSSSQRASQKLQHRKLAAAPLLLLVFQLDEGSSRWNPLLPCFKGESYINIRRPPDHFVSSESNNGTNHDGHSTRLRCIVLDNFLNCHRFTVPCYATWASLFFRVLRLKTWNSKARNAEYTMRLCALPYSIPHNAQSFEWWWPSGFCLCGRCNSRYRKEPSERHWWGALVLTLVLNCW